MVSMQLEEPVEAEDLPANRTSFKKMFYVNRKNFKVSAEGDSRPITKVWGNAYNQILHKTNSTTESTSSLISAEELPSSSAEPEQEPEPEPAVPQNTGTNRAIGLIRKLPYGGPLLRKFGAAEKEEEEFELPSEYLDSSEDEMSDFDPEAVYILPVLGEEHIFDKRKTIVLRRDMFNAKHIKSTFNIVDRKNKFHFRVEAELYDLKRERVLTDKSGKPTMGLRYDFLKSSWHVLGGDNLKERRAVVRVKKSVFGNSCQVFVHLPPYPLAIEAPALDKVKPLLKVKGASIEDGFEVVNIHEDKQWARIKKDLEYLTHWSFGTDSYYVEVQPYIDTALMVALGIIMEEETTTERERPFITGNLFKDVMLQVADNLYR